MSTIKNKLIIVSLFFLAVLLSACGLFYMQSRARDAQAVKSQQILAVNELEQLAARGDMETLSQKSRELQESMAVAQEPAGGDRRYLLLGAICAVYVLCVFGYVYGAVLRPFGKMKAFAAQIARGNFDVPLDYTRANYFGDFTWAFDSMRREITKARASEREAVENNKTVIATLSHDIKTPIASIRAYAEGLEANMDSSEEKRQKYLAVIMKKCDEVSSLTDDLFLHSLSDLERLRVLPEKFALCGFLKRMAEEVSAGQGDVRLTLPEEDALVLADEKRLMQVCENLINNARKYAKTKLDVSVAVDGDTVSISFRDYGRGIPDEDMPFIYGKFYRGKNCGDEQGSGLGLYIVKYITEKMGGKVLLHNYTDGLEAVVSIPVAEE